MKKAISKTLDFFMPKRIIRPGDEKMIRMRVVRERGLHEKH
jgi:hypothetical protein